MESLFPTDTLLAVPFSFGECKFIIKYRMIGTLSANIISLPEQVKPEIYSNTKTIH